ncbi:MAG: putative basic amino acid antiporter YfcC [Spirochaetes bacterium]|nr:putative basic amino acid antiporter YfcC [Spirochaetota bacterium]
MVANNKKYNTINSYAIIFFIVIFIWLLTYIIPVGKFENRAQYYFDKKHQELNIINVIDPDSYEMLIDANGKPQKLEVPIFGEFTGIGLLNYIFEGGKSAVSIILFILIVGGSFGIIMKTKSIDEGILSIINKFKSFDIILIPILFFLFSLGGAVFGMGEEAIAFAIIVIPILVSLGYDAVLGVLITYGATQIGFATSWMNPFSLVIAQGIANVPILSGATLRIIIWFLFTIGGIIFCIIYGNKIKKDPSKSLSYDTDNEYFRKQLNSNNIETKFTIGHLLIILTLFIGIIWIIYGVVVKEYYIGEIAAQFFTIGLISAIIALIFKLNNMNINDVCDAFITGAKDLLPAALIVGMAKGIIIIMTLGNPSLSATSPNILNTILFYTGNSLKKLPTFITIFFMYLFQSVFNFFVPSGSGQASLTMPILAPIAKMSNISRQTAILAFQFGDGFTNLIVPTSAALMGVLAIAKIDWSKWFKFMLKIQIAIFIICFFILCFTTIPFFAKALGSDWIEPEMIINQQLKKEVKPNVLYEYNLPEKNEFYIKINVNENKTYEIYLIDSFNNSFHKTKFTLKAIYFEIYNKNKTEIYKDIYTEPAKSGGYTPESEKPAAIITPKENVIYIRVKGDKDIYSGTFGLMIKEKK